LLRADQLNAYDVLCSDWVVFTPASLPTGGETEAEAGGKAKAGKSDAGGEAEVEVGAAATEEAQP
jgi:hypothetical protein